MPVDTFSDADAYRIAEYLNRPFCWVDFKHPEYVLLAPRWQFAQDHYTGEAVAENKIIEYLIKKGQGESDEAYTERKALADLSNHFATVIDSLAGLMFQAEGNASRTWTKSTAAAGSKEFGPLGDPENVDSHMYRLFQDADGLGNGWLTLFKQIATELTVMHRYWMFVDAADGNPKVRMIPPMAVTNWLYDGDNLVEALVREQLDNRESLEDFPQPMERYLRFQIGKWTRYKKVKGPDGQEVAVAEDSGTYDFVDPAGRPSLPIFVVNLPMRRMVGWILAKKQNAMFNMESARDHIIRVANFPKLILSAVDEVYLQLLKGLREGNNALQEDPEKAGQGHRYITPNGDNARVASDVLTRKVQEFYTTAFREYSQSARQKTATEAKQDVAEGVGAYLQHLKSALDDAENNCYWRLEQCLKPGAEPIAHVQRSDEFVPVDMQAMMEQMSTRYAGFQRPILGGVTARVDAFKQILTHDAVDYDQDELTAAVQVDMLNQFIRDNPQMILPTELKSRVLAKFLAASGLVDATQVIQMGDGEEVPLLDYILQQAVLQDAQNAQMNAEGGSAPGAAPGQAAPAAPPADIDPETVAMLPVVAPPPTDEDGEDDKNSAGVAPIDRSDETDPLTSGGVNLEPQPHPAAGIQY